MAEIAAIVIQTLQWVGAPVTRQFQYLCCFSRNITSLRNEANQLEDTTQDLRVRVERERNDLQVINREVKTWLQNSNDIKHEKDDILKEVPNVESGCMKLGARFFLSRRAKKTTDRVKELRDRCKLRDDVISQPRATASTHPIPSGMTYEFESRKQIEKEIMTTVLGRDVNMIGIWGMGGQGKTTMAKRIMNKVLNHGFEAVIAEVGQKVDVSKIQLEIGGSLGLKLEGETSQATVQKLHARLTGGRKRILLVLDNVWETLSPEDIGIPSDYKECTILITSRDRNVLRAMNVQKIFYMEVLSAKDSWIMFRDRVGTCVDNTELNSIAKEVVNECKGLPLALTTVGAALKNEVDVNDWKNSLRQLRKCDPDNSEFIKEVYNPLKLSYDALDPNYQYVFLLCCLYPKGVDIPLEQLTYFCMGLRIFEGGVGNVEEARNRMHALTKVLKSRSLLLDSKNGDGHVRMHDVVRDVCKFIAKKKGYISDDDRSWSSSMQIYKLPSGLGLLRISDSGDEEFKFDGIRDLHVLSIEKYCSLTSLPFTQRPKNLITLVLDSCGGLETLSAVGKLVNLEILICRGCDSIKELPPEIKGLNRLKVLELTRCKNLQTIGRGIISSLVGLEELKMLKSFDKWEAEDREERENAGLRELEALTKLSCLEIEIQDPSLAEENIRLSSEVDRFTITYFHSGIRQNVSKFDQYLSKKKMHLNLEEATHLGDWIKMQLLTVTECLYLVGNGANNVDLTKPEKLKFLVLGKCKTMKNVVTTTSMDDGGGATVFPFIEHLNLFKLAKLQEMCDRGVSSDSFQNLKVIKLDDLPALKQLWKSSRNDLGKDFLPHLEGLDIRDCERMKQVFFWNGEDGNEKNNRHRITKMFPKLKELELRNLPKLISLCQGIEGIEFPLLRKMGILQCGNMKGMVANGLSSNADTHHLFCESQLVSFGCLKKLQITDGNPFCSHKIHVSLFNGLEKLTISDHAGSLSLFTSSSMAGNLVSLQQLEISLCEEMVEVIKDDDEKGMSGALLFPKLRTLHLGDLPKLVSFCKWKCDVELPLLRELKIYNCHNMKTCTWGLLTTPNLKSVDLDDQDFGAVKDLNHILQQQYFNRTEKKQAEEAEEEEKKKKQKRSRKEGEK